MKPFKQFILSGYQWDESQLTASFSYSFDDEQFFTEKIDFTPLQEKNYFKVINTDRENIENILAHLHIALGVSYYKLYPTKEIVVNTLQLTENQKKFWNTFYLKWLWEFFYRNQLDPRGLAQFKSAENAKNQNNNINFEADKLLVLFWWGKDSLVSVELLKKQGKKFDLFSFWKDFPLHAVAQEPTEAKRLIIKRMLDLENINKLLEKWYYNGHLPITWIISFVSLMVWYLYGYRGVITSLEKSADEGNTLYYGMEINHQWSKSKEFEDLFINYVETNITKDFFSKSYLRDWYEVRVVKEFSQYPQYFNHFSSCNRNFHITGSKLSWEDLWCWVCPKCWFVYTMLRAFIGKDKVNKIFNKDLFEDKSLIQLFKELLWIDGIKPFECVWTNEEMVIAFRLITQKEPDNMSEIITIFKNEIMSKLTTEDFEKLRKKLGI